MTPTLTLTILILTLTLTLTLILIVGAAGQDEGRQLGARGTSESDQVGTSTISSVSGVSGPVGMGSPRRVAFNNGAGADVVNPNHDPNPSPDPFPEF